MTDVDLQADGFVNYGLFPSYIPAYDAEVFTEPDEFFGGQKIYETFIELGKKVPAVNYTENYNEAMKLPALPALRFTWKARIRRPFSRILRRI